LRNAEPDKVPKTSIAQPNPHHAAVVRTTCVAIEICANSRYR
jgi:hypothetical protein